MFRSFRGAQCWNADFPTCYGTGDDDTPAASTAASSPAGSPTPSTQWGSFRALSTKGRKSS